jgi:hypothetical protein
MIGVTRNIVDYRELIASLAWKNTTMRITMRYTDFGTMCFNP